MEHYCRRLAYSGWTATSVTMTDIPVNKAQLHGRVGDYDGGETAAWMAGLRVPTWRAVRDAVTGHSIHCVSDRPFAALTKDLERGLRLLGWMTTKTSVVWYWWDHDWTRILPTGVQPGPTHINGGWAVPGTPEVHVYRREEAHKVLIHETIHAIGLDVPQTVMDPIRVRFEGALGHALWPHLGEAFTEFYAEWLWSIAAATGLGDAKKRWDYQLACSAKQAAIIWGRTRGQIVAEKTNVFAYYILKWVLMGHTEEVLLGPTASARHWFDWWMATTIVPVETGEDVPLGMTCK